MSDRRNWFRENVIISKFNPVEKITFKANENFQCSFQGRSRMQEVLITVKVTFKADVKYLSNDLDSWQSYFRWYFTVTIRFSICKFISFLCIRFCFCFFFISYMTTSRSPLDFFRRVNSTVPLLIISASSSWTWRSPGTY